MYDPLKSSSQFITRMLRFNLQSLHRRFWHIMAPPAFQSEPIALLIDGENVSWELAVYLLAAAGKFGGVTVRRVYGNWAQPSMKHWQSIATHYNILTVHYQPPISGKNATDIKLVVDAMELWHAGIRRFCLVSSDSDYTPLVQRLNEQGCFVLGIGKAETPTVLRKACTVFCPLEDLIPPSSQKNASPPPVFLPPDTPASPLSTKPAETIPVVQAVPKETPLQKLLVQAYKQLVVEEGQEWVPLMKLAYALKKLDPTFNLKAHASSSKVLMQKHAHIFEMQKREDGHSDIRMKPELQKKKKS